MPQPKNLRNRSLNLCRQICQAYDLEVHLVLVREKDGQQPGGHGVVEDRVDGGVDVEHEAGEVKQVVEQLKGGIIRKRLQRGTLVRLRYYRV